MGNGYGRNSTQGSAHHSEGTVAQHTGVCPPGVGTVAQHNPRSSMEVPSPLLTALIAPCLRRSLCLGCTPRQIPVLGAQMESSLNLLGVPLDGAGTSKCGHIVPSPDNAEPPKSL